MLHQALGPPQRVQCGTVIMALKQWVCPVQVVFTNASRPLSIWYIGGKCLEPSTAVKWYHRSEKHWSAWYLLSCIHWRVGAAIYNAVSALGPTIGKTSTPFYFQQSCFQSELLGWSKRTKCPGAAEHLLHESTGSWCVLHLSVFRKLLLRPAPRGPLGWTAGDQAGKWTWEPWMGSW